jgi:COMPASS component BRE2
VPNPHVRIGWGRREAILDAPVGLDAYSYGLRDVGCEKIHLSRRKVYGDPNRHLRTGDTVGCLITLPPRPKIQSNGRNSDPAVITRNRAPLKFKGQMYLESEEYRPAREMEAKVDREGKLAKEAAEAARLATIETNIEDPEPGAKVSKGKGKTKQKQTKSKSKIKDLELGNHDIEIDRTPTTLKGSSISFFLNGAPMSDEPAFRDLYDFIPLPPHSSTNIHQGKKGEPVKGLQHDDGTLGYYPMISVFGRGKVKLNFGPTFHAPPPTVEGLRPMCDRYDEFREEERIQDELDELEWIERINHDLKEAEDKKEVLIKRKLAADLRKRGGGRGRGRGGSASTPTPRSRLGTESTPGPGYSGLGVEDSPKSEPGLGGVSVKREVEVESVGGAESRAQSERLETDVDLPVPEAESGIEIGGETERRPELDAEMDAEGEEEEQDNKPIDWEYFTS